MGVAPILPAGPAKMVLRLGRLAAVRAGKDVDGDSLVGLFTGALQDKAA